LLFVAASLSACTLPRGAARPSEVLRVDRSAEPVFDVVAVTGDSLPGILDWPSDGQRAPLRWLASGGGSGQLIRPGDLVDLVIWDSQENSLLAPETAKTVDIKGLRVGPEGEIFVPYIEQVSVAGLSSDQARAKIQTGLASIAPDAQVQLAVSAGSNSMVDLIGGVQRPGRFALTNGRLTILSLLAEGGGIPPTIANPLVRLQRGGESYVISAEKLFQEPGRDVTLRGGDRVVVEADPRYFVALGAAGSQKLVPFEKAEITALDALSMIGGLTPARANLKGVMVLRDYPEAALRFDGLGPSMPQTIFTFDLTRADGLFAARKFPIQSEDLILATESPIPAANTVLALFGTTLGLATRITQ
jgi:polysaccharide export outer membrane protein